jgi:DUF1009 family protein
MNEHGRPRERVVGVLAGRGDYPQILIEKILAAGLRVALVGIRGQFSGRVPAGVSAAGTVPLGDIGAVARFFLECGATRAFMAGGVRRSGAWRDVRPDLRGLALLPRAVLGGDDGLLRALADRFAGLGVEIGDPSEFLTDLFAPRGAIAGPRLADAARDDLELAWSAAIEHGSAGRGQAVLVHRGRVVDREDRAGTDALLARAPGPGAVMAKAVKPGQDRRFDMPVIGPSTIIVASLVGVRAIAVEAGGVLLLGKGRVLELCEERGVSLVGIGQSDQDLSDPQDE